MNTALYDLGKQPTTFDFAAWVVIAKTHGADHVRFVYEDHIAAWKYPEHIAWKRFGNVLIPLTMLGGMTFSVGPKVSGNSYPYLIGEVEKTFKRLGRLGKLRSTVQVKKNNYITVTLRDSFRNRYRNSNMKAWERFVDYAEKRGKEVVIFPECENNPIDLLHRMAMYSGADMNLGVNGGPMTLCLYSEAPYVMLNMCPPNNTGEKTYSMENLFRACDFWQKQFSFANDKQRLVWDADSYENIVNAYESLMDERAVA